MNVDRVFNEIRLAVTTLAAALRDRDKEVMTRLSGFRQEIVDDIDALQDRCLREIALKQPFGKDFRRLAALMKISTSLERVARYVSHSAEYAAHVMEKEVPENILDGVAKLAALADKALNDALISFFYEDERFLDRGRLLEETIDREFNALWKTIINRARESCNVEDGIYLALLIRSIERLGDHAVEIIRRVEYYIRGELPWRSSSSD